MIAQARGDYDRALEWYQRALEIFEELGTRSGMAISFSQIGILFTKQGAPEEAVPLNLRGLAIHVEIGSPKTRIDLGWLGRQREMLGSDRFGELLRANLDDAAAQKVLEMLEQ